MCQNVKHFHIYCRFKSLQISKAFPTRTNIKIDIFFSIFSPRLLAQNFIEGKFLDTTKNTFFPHSIHCHHSGIRCYHCIHIISRLRVERNFYIISLLPSFPIFISLALKRKNIYKRAENALQHQSNKYRNESYSPFSGFCPFCARCLFSIEILCFGFS